ncbi:MAG: tRNA (adenosine(37)-N6)-threonylcarbamoyltransferase complex dimerization subunit type 1 TsaB [Chloroflexota bacterium]
MLLAIDTATKMLGLALHAGDTLIAEKMWRTGNKHNMILAPTIEHMLTICDVDKSDLTMIAVANGPGSYAGLRIGVALAKGMAAVKNLPLIGVSTLDIIAAGQTFTNTRHQLICVVQAGRKRIIAGVYQVKKGRWEAVETPEITTWADLLASLEGSYYVAGEVDPAGREAIAMTEDNEELSVSLVEAARRARRTGFLAQEAWRRYHAGEPSDFLPAKLTPVYLNSPG